MTASSSYEILELPADATLDQVKAAYRRLAPQVHPDHGGSHELFRQVLEAYVSLTRELSTSPGRGSLLARRSPRAHRPSARSSRDPGP